MAKVIVERRGAVLELRLNRPELLNAVDREAIAALGAAAAEAAADRAARVVLFSGEGTHFCAGGDITMFGELVRLPPEERRKLIYADGRRTASAIGAAAPYAETGGRGGPGRGGRGGAQLCACRRSGDRRRGCGFYLRLCPSRHQP